jgi:hypothetical protein
MSSGVDAFLASNRLTPPMAWVGSLSSPSSIWTPPSLSVYQEPRRARDWMMSLKSGVHNLRWHFREALRLPHILAGCHSTPRPPPIPPRPNPHPAGGRQPTPRLPLARSLCTIPWSRRVRWDPKTSSRDRPNHHSLVPMVPPTPLIALLGLPVHISLRWQVVMFRQHQVQTT